MNGPSNNCPCDGFVFPQTISNPPGRDTISYRVGDYFAFREALLRSRPGEIELANWRPGAEGDLAVQMVEWWAYLADILTFYNERIANGDYLRTAVLPENVQGLIRLLGYRPRPGIGATGTVAALLTGFKPLALPPGFQIQSKPGPGKQPQIFELGSKTPVQLPDVIAADPVPDPSLLGAQGNSVLLQGVIKSVKAGDNLLLLEKGWQGNDRNYAVVTVQSTASEKDPRGKTNTRVTFAESPSQLLSAAASNFRLLKSGQSTRVWQYPADTVIQSNQVDLESISRAIQIGDPVLFDVGSVAATRGIYFSPDGRNLGGGGNTISKGALDRNVVDMIDFQAGVITAFDDGSIFYSQDGQNLSGGGNTLPAYTGTQQLVMMAAFAAGVIAVLFDGNNYNFYLSPDGSNLGGGGQTTPVGVGDAGPIAIVPFGGGVITALYVSELDTTDIWLSSDGTDVIGNNGQSQLLFSGTPATAMIRYQSGIITAFNDGTIYYSPNGQDPAGQTPGTQTTEVYGGTILVKTMLAYQTAAVITCFMDGSVYLSPDGTNLGGGGGTTKVYAGQSLVQSIIAYGNGVITAFDDGSIYFSPDGTNLKGGGSTVQVYDSAPSAIALLAWNGGVLTAFPIPQLELVSVQTYTEVVWFANPDSDAHPELPPTGSPTPFAIPIPHSRITFRPALTGIPDTAAERSILSVEFSWRDVGTLIPTPATTLTGTELTLLTPLPPYVLPMADQNVLVSDAHGNGFEAAATTSDPYTIGLSSPNGPSDSTWASTLASLNLVAPFSVLFDLLPVTRGKTIANEILGSGDATVTAGQEFVLQKSPLTYLQSSNSTSGSDYSSTLKVWVDGVEWQEVPSFYGQSANAQVFVTSEDDQNKTHVLFGDGVNGSRLPSGLNNVIATYRIGSGAESPDAGSLTVILKSWPGLKAIMNPVQAGGGADADLPSQIKTDAPQSVLTFGRAISADDYEVTARQAPGVARARAYWNWDNAQQRNMVKVYVGDDQNAVISANAALAGASDPNRPLNVILATQVPIGISLSLLIDPKYVPDDVAANATAALVDPDRGLLGANVVQIGASLFQSQVYQACLSVAGVVAVQNLTITGVVGQTCSTCPNCDYRFDPGEGGYFQVTTPSDQIISPEVATSAG